MNLDCMLKFSLLGYVEVGFLKRYLKFLADRHTHTDDMYMQ